MHENRKGCLLNSIESSDLRRDLDQEALKLLLPLRANKTIDPDSLARYLQLLDRLAAEIGESLFVDRKLAGELWFVFTSMLTEADHARDGEQILDAAWKVQEKLRRVFGPRY